MIARLTDLYIRFRYWVRERERKKYQAYLRVPNKPNSGFIDSTKRNSTRAVP